MSPAMMTSLSGLDFQCSHTRIAGSSITNIEVYIDVVEGSPFSQSQYGKMYYLNILKPIYRRILEQDIEVSIGRAGWYFLDS